MVTAKHILSTAPKRFRAEKAVDVYLLFHFDFSDEIDGQYSIVIDKGKCTFHTEWVGVPSCVVKTSSKIYSDIEMGVLNPQSALLSGAVFVSDISALLHFAKLFRKFDEKYLKDELFIFSQKKQIERPQLQGPLSGIRILDFSRLLPGPMATMLLADMGAEVIKIEDPDNPDYIRGFEPLIDGVSAFYYALNRNKKSLAVNYLSNEGKVLLFRLIDSADILIEQFRPGVMKAFGLDYEVVHERNPRLIYASITGYGQHSSISQQAGHDLNYLALSGLLGINGTNSETITIPGFQIADVAGGAYMTMNAILAALFQRERSGKGTRLDIAMTDAVVPLAALPLAAYQATKSGIPRGAFQLSGGLANYNVYRCSDGQFLALGALEPKFWNSFCDALGRSDWKEKIIGGREVHSLLRKEIEILFQSNHSQYWLDFFEGKEVCISKVLELKELDQHPYFIEKKLFVEQQIAGKPFQVVRNPVQFLDHENSSWIAPTVGEDTLSLLKTLKLTDLEIQELYNGGTVA